jgi:hypothetical protein
MRKIKEKIEKMFESKMFVGILYGIGSVIILLAVLSVGISIGFHKASFGKAWGDNYERNFGMMPQMRGGFNFGNDNFPNAHGAIGKIIKIQLPTLIVQDKDNTEKVILTKEDTKIQKMRNTILPTDLHIDDFVIVVGSPNDKGQVEAKLIRIMPSPELLNNQQTNDKLPQ